MTETQTDSPTEVVLRLMQLAPYRALSLRGQQAVVGGNECVFFTKEDFREIIKHFLRLIPFDEQKYLQASTDVANAIATGRYRHTAFRHFIESGYFEGRRPVPIYLPEDHEFASALRELPRPYLVAVHQGMTAYRNFDYGTAERCLREALAVCPGSYQAKRLLGYILHRTGRHLEALRFLEMAQKIRTDAPDLPMWLASVCQSLSMPDERAAHLDRAFALSGKKDPHLAGALAEALGSLGYAKQAHHMFASLAPAALGGGGIAAKERAVRALADARQRLRSLMRQARNGGLTEAQQVDLAYEFARVGFRRAASLLVNKVSAGLRAGQKFPTASQLVKLAEAARISRGLRGAIGILGGPAARKSLDAQVICHRAALLYRSGDFAGALEALSESAAAARTELGLQYLVLASFRSGEFNQALDFCRSWMVTHPESSQWAAMTLMILTERGDIPFAHIPGSGEPTYGAWGEHDQIPNRIAQFWNDAQPPQDVQEALSSWAANNTAFRYQLFNDVTGREFVRSVYGDSATEAYDYCAHAAMRADYFRLAYLAEVGGFFIDADERNLLPLTTALGMCANKSLVLARADRMVLFASPVGCAPHHPLMIEMFETARDALLRAKLQGQKLNSWQATGPGVITRVVGKRLLADDSERNRVLANTAFIHAIDRSRILREETFDYKQSKERNWRFH